MFVQSNEALERSFDIDAQGFVLEMIADNYSEMGEYEIALKTLDRAMQMSPDDDDLIAKHADMLGESGDFEGAISQWGEYIKNILAILVAIIDVVYLKIIPTARRMPLQTTKCQ